MVIAPLKLYNLLSLSPILANIEEISIELKPIIYIIKVFMIVTVIIIIYKLFY